jgi:hypothetical protein
MKGEVKAKQRILRASQQLRGRRAVRLLMS